MYEQEIIEDFSPQKELTKVNFLICFIEQLFKDKKHLLDNSKELEKEKQTFNEGLNLPFVINSKRVIHNWTKKAATDFSVAAIA